MRVKEKNSSIITLFKTKLSALKVPLFGLRLKKDGRVIIIDISLADASILLLYHSRPWRAALSLSDR